MRVSYFAIIVFLIQTTSAFSQEKFDTLYTFNKTIVGKVKEVGHTDVQYTLPNEEVVYRLYKRSVLSITFSSGRKKVFNEAKNFEPLKNSAEWSKVNISTIPEEINGMTKIDFVTVKATGATVYSSVSNTQDRAFRKLKQAAVILGGNVVFIDNQSVEGNIYGERTTRTQLTGTIFRSMPMDTAGLFKNIVNGTFQPTIRKTLGNNNSEPQISPVYPANKITISGLKSFEFSNGLLYFNHEMNEAVSKFIVTHFDYKQLTVAYKDKSRFVEITLMRVKK